MPLDHGYPDHPYDEAESPSWPQCVCCGVEDEGDGRVTLAPDANGDLACVGCLAAVEVVTCDVCGGEFEHGSWCSEKEVA